MWFNTQASEKIFGVIKKEYSILHIFYMKIEKKKTQNTRFFWLLFFIPF